MDAPFTRRLLDWFAQHGRHNLPWSNGNPYCVWVSEIMLQQTQVCGVLAYYPRFLAAFPDVAALAAAREDEVLAQWAGLGYYSRARNLHHAAQQIMRDFHGQFPQNRAQWQTLKGVGRSTAAAICAFAFRQPEAILDGNVRRVLCRVFALDGDPSERAFEAQLWAKAESLLPAGRAEIPAYTQAVMDLGATVCTRSPQCGICPQNTLCQALAQNRVKNLPRPKKAVPVKEIPLIWAVVIRADGAVLLQKRPAGGIWGGMYGVPSYGNREDFRRFCRTFRLPESTETHHVRHRLTHRLLHIEAHIFRLPENFLCADAPVFRQPETFPAQFFTPAQRQKTALPAPLAKLLHTLAA